jgi:DNA replication and repair protein RecF
LESWEAELVLLGSRVIRRRLRFIQAFSQYLAEAYARIERVAEQPTITYDGIAPLELEAAEEAIAEAFRQQLKRVAKRERERGRTLIGPHRDDLIFKLNDMPVRRYASQGQHRTFGMALKLAQYFYLQERLEEQPILLLDDVFGHFDDERRGVFLNLLQTEAIGQSIITDTQWGAFAEHVLFDDPRHSAIPVSRGETQAVVHNDVATRG